MKTAILVVSFGTSHKDAREHSLDCILQDIKEFVRDWKENTVLHSRSTVSAGASDDITVYHAYTSGMILNILVKEGIKIPTVKEAVDRILSEDIKRLIVVPTHMIPGIEYHKMLDDLKEYSGQFDKIMITTTVLENQCDCEDLVPILQEIIDFKPDIEYILMGHGTEADANIRYGQMNEALAKAGLSNVWIASVEAKPNIDDALERLDRIRNQKNISKVVVQPFMVVAGDHAKNDMAGEGDSYVTKLRESGFAAETVVRGLGEYPQFRKIYVNKVKEIL